MNMCGNVACVDNAVDCMFGFFGGFLIINCQYISIKNIKVLNLLFSLLLSLATTAMRTKPPSTLSQFFFRTFSLPFQ